MRKMYKIRELYKNLSAGAHLLPTSTGIEFWEAVYTANASVIDREFARRFADFAYFDFLGADDKDEATTNLKADVLSILTFNQKRYEEMYRVFLVADADDPITYNYDMTETTGAQHTETEYGATSATKGQETFTKGSETFTKGAQENTEGAVTTTHNVAPMNSTTPIADSSDGKTSQTFNDGQRLDTYSQRQDTTGSRTDTTNAHTDQYDSDEWTLTRRGNIGVQTAGDILRIHTEYWTEKYKFLQLIFDDIAKQILMIGDDERCHIV